LVTVHARTNPMEIYRYNRLRSVSFSLKLKPGVGLMEGITKVNESAKEILPRDARIDWTGETRRYLSESQNVVLIFVLALFFIYFVMAAQFESWIDPFIIMLSVPLSLAGAVITLALIENGSINLYSQIGFVTLIGLITKHGILMVDVANRLRDEGKERLTAIIMASRMRLRPILMTTFAMVLGAVPLALATGAGYESRRQIGWVIVGGMSVGTLFTLFVLPAFYYYLARRTRVPMKDLPE
jgi:multidrug efflux pump